jgi:hypothetical protein
MMASNITEIKVLIVEKVGGMVSQWAENHYQCASFVCTMAIQTRARSLFENLNTISPHPKVQSLLQLQAGFSILNGTMDSAADLVTSGKLPALLQVESERHGVPTFPIVLRVI